MRTLSKRTRQIAKSKQLPGVQPFLNMTYCKIHSDEVMNATTGCLALMTERNSDSNRPGAVMPLMAVSDGCGARVDQSEHCTREEGHFHLPPC